MTENDLTRFIFPIPPGLTPIANSSDVAIIGSEGTHKTTILLQAAVEILSKNPDSTVIFISAKCMERLPPHIHLMSKFNLELGKRLFIYYVHCADELLKFITQYHTKSSFPISIMIDDLQEFVTPNFIESMQTKDKYDILCKILRNLQHLASWLRWKSGKPCYLFVASREHRATYFSHDSSDERIDSPDKSMAPEFKDFATAACSFHMSCVLNVEADKVMKDLFILTNEMNSTAIEFHFSDHELHLKSVYRYVTTVDEEAVEM